MNSKAGYEKIIGNLKRLRPMLPAGYTGMIAEKFGVTTATVCNALAGKTRRFDIIEYAIELAEQNVKIAERLNEIVNKQCRE